MDVAGQLGETVTGNVPGKRGSKKGEFFTLHSPVFYFLIFMFCSVPLRSLCIHGGRFASKHVWSRWRPSTEQYRPIGQLCSKRRCTTRSGDQWPRCRTFWRSKSVWSGNLWYCRRRWQRKWCPAPL